MLKRERDVVEWTVFGFNLGISVFILGNKKQESPLQRESFLPQLNSSRPHIFRHSVRDVFSESRSHPSRLSSLLTIVVIVITSVNQIESSPDLPPMITWQSLVPMGPSRQLFLFGFMVFALYALPERLTLVFLLCLIHTQSPTSASHHCPNHKCHFKIMWKK